MKTKSLKVKMTLWYTLLLVVLLSIFLPIAYKLLTQFLTTSSENELRVEATHIVQEIKSSEELHRIRTRYDYTVLIIDRNQQIVTSNNDNYQAFLKQPMHRDIWTSEIDDANWMLLDTTIEVDQNVYLVRIAASLNQNETFLKLVRMVMWIGAPILILLAFLSGLWIAKKTLYPIYYIAQTAKQIEAGDLHKRIENIHSKDEVGMLATSFNKMVDTLETTLKREQQFASDASHELRTPLQILLNYSEQLLLNDENEHHEEYLAIHDEILKMNKIINQLLSLTRGDQGKYTLQLEPLLISDMLTSIIEQLQPFALSKHIHMIRCEASPIQIYADQSLMTQLFINLIDNAIKYTNEGGQIQTSIYQHHHSVDIVIKDTGIGISEEALPLVFTRFYREDTSRDRSGRSIVKWIVDMHHASIHIESIKHKGTTVRVTLPIYLLEK